MTSVNSATMSLTTVLSLAKVYSKQLQNIFKLKINIDCECNLDGSNGCDEIHGQCFCNENIEGKYCDHCAINFFGFPDCQGMIFKELQQ